jgi:3-isopropylmalate/(R)-2-methylmalate dehydratase large subunit
MASDTDATWDDVVRIDGGSLAPTVTWGINPGQSVSVDAKLPRAEDVPASERPGLAEALQFMGFSSGQPMAGTRIDVAFIGSCTNGRLSDLREAAHVVAGKKVAKHVRALVVPGSQKVAIAAEREVCASSSNRNFKGRQGSPTGRTLLMSPAMVAAAAVAGEVVDIRSWSPELVGTTA